MISALTLSTLSSRVASLLTDETHAIFAVEVIEQGAHQALAAFNRASLHPDTAIRPNALISTMTPGANVREWDLTDDCPGFISMTEVWFPYVDDPPDLLPMIADGRVVWNAGEPFYFLSSLTTPNGTDVARFFYVAAHTLDGLGSASATTIFEEDENTVVMGAAGFTCLARAADLNESAATSGLQTPNYGTLGDYYLKLFYSALAPRKRVHTVKMRNR